MLGKEGSSRSNYPHEDAAWPCTLQQPRAATEHHASDARGWSCRPRYRFWRGLRPTLVHGDQVSHSGKSIQQANEQQRTLHDTPLHSQIPGCHCSVVQPCRKLRAYETSHLMSVSLRPSSRRAGMAHPPLPHVSLPEARRGMCSRQFNRGSWEIFQQASGLSAYARVLMADRQRFCIRCALAGAVGH